MFASEEDERDPRLQAISAAIRVVPHFPKPGIMFQDITTLLLHPKAFKDAVDIFIDRYRDMEISVVAGIEARGFLFGPSIALAIGAKFVPLRKPRKLPGRVISEEYVLEYGTDCLEMDVEAVQPGERAVVIDDLVATGGTLCAAIRLLGGAAYGQVKTLSNKIGFFKILSKGFLESRGRNGSHVLTLMSAPEWNYFISERVGAEVVECACLIGLPELKGDCKLNGKPVYILVEPRQ